MANQNAGEPLTMTADLRNAASAGRLVAIMGAGTSIGLASPATPAKNWRELLNHCFSYAKEVGAIDQKQLERWADQAQADDLDELLAAADFVVRKLGGPPGLLYSRWLESNFSKQKAKTGPLRDAVSALSKARIPLATLNYDTLLERVTKTNSIHMNDARRVIDWGRKDNSDILHLHGVWNHPETCIFGSGDYQIAINDEFRQNLQRSLASFANIVFVGCGDTLHDPNFATLLRWMADVLGAAAPLHYMLVRNDDVDRLKCDPILRGLVEPIAFGSSYDDLPKFLLSDIAVASPMTAVSHRTRMKSESPSIQAYRKYLIKDCGQMTIEGIRADADTVKQRFDLERLFVPLSVNPLPPDFPEGDKNRERKLKRWRDKNQATMSFGEAFAANSRIALLALPGGGKTLLLKRLAVAYADDSRRSLSEDHLPPINLLPILIRCREWREHIRLPIQSIIERLGDISGKPEFNGIFQAASA